LIGSAGTGTAFAAAMALRRRWPDRVRLVAMDMNPGHLVTSALLADAFEQVPASSDTEFAAALVDILRRHHIDTYLPLIDLEILRAAELREKGLLPHGLVTLAPSAASARACLDKLETASIVQSAGIAVPLTAPATQPFASKQYFLKPRRGFGSRGAGIVARDELDLRAAPRAEDWVVQEICPGPEMTVDVSRAPSRQLLRVVCRDRLEVKAGVCTKARVFDDAAHAAVAERIGRTLGLAGGYCFQMMNSSRGWLVTDVNARLGAGTALSVAAGVDFFAATFANAWGLDASQFLPPLPGECFVTRQYAEFLMT
jgi:carbamoylphosphate synthase large subunit